MARIRTIKPEFFTSADIVCMTPLSRLFYASLWCEADREGRLKWDTRTLKLRYFPADNCDIDAMAQELIDNSMIVIYEVDGKQYAEIPSFKTHQVINNRESESCLPSRVKDASPRVQGEGKGKEGKGKEGATKRESSIPANFSISDAVRSWAEKHNHKHLDKHLAHFIDTAKAKGYTYIDWDAAFRKAIAGNWAKVDNSQPEAPSDPNELITLPNGQQITRARQQWLLEMTR